MVVFADDIVKRVRVFEHPMSTGRKVHISKKRSFRSGKPETTFDIYDTELAGEGNGESAVAMDGTDMESQMELWRQKAASMSGSAGILAGGDGSAKKKKGIINRCVRMGESMESVRPRWNTGSPRRQMTFK